MKRTFLLCAGALAAGSIGMAATSIDTTVPSLWDGTSAFGTLGDNLDPASLATFGQVVTAPATDTVLTDFSFALNANLTQTPSVLRFYVFNWDSVNHHTTGSALYASGTLNSFPSSFQLAGPSGLSINSPAGTQLVLVASSEEVADADPNDTSTWDSAEVGVALVENDAYNLGSAFVKGYGGGDLTTLGDPGWNEYNPTTHSDFAFTANFTAPLVDAPEAGTVAAGALLSLSAAGLVLTRSKAARS